MSLFGRPHLSFSTGTDLSSVECDRCGDFLKCLPLQDAHGSPDGQCLYGSSARYVLPDSNVLRVNPRSLASRLFKARRFFAAVIDRLVHAKGVRYPKAKTPLHPAHRRCNTHQVSTWCVCLRPGYSLTRR